jgi:hypothetical protein
MFTKPDLCAAAVIAAGMAIASPPAMAQEASPVTHHTTAAEHHEQAARHHREAARHHEARRTELAAHHAHLAHGHSIQASDNAEEAAKLHMQQYGTASNNQ